MKHIDWIIGLITGLLLGAFVGFHYGWGVGHDKAEASNRESRERVSRQMDELGFCDWADKFKEQHQCGGPTP